MQRDTRLIKLMLTTALRLPRTEWHIFFISTTGNGTENVVDGYSCTSTAELPEKIKDAMLDVIQKRDPLDMEVIIVHGS